MAVVAGPRRHRSGRAPVGSDERLLVARVRRGDDEAFAVIFERYHRQLVGYCARMLSSRADGEDAAQLVFVSALKSIRSTTAALELKPWLYRIAHNRCVSMLRVRREHAELTEQTVGAASHEPAVEERVQHVQDVRDLLGDVARLPDSQREALLLSQLAGVSGQESAQIIGCTPAKVRSLVHQARQTLGADRDARRLACPQVRASLLEQSGTLTREQRRHVRLCDDCAEYRTALERRDPALAGALAVQPSPAFARDALRDILTSTRVAVPTGGAASHHPLVFALTLGALLVLGAMLLPTRLKDSVPGRTLLAPAGTLAARTLPAAHPAGRSGTAPREVRMSRPPSHRAATASRSPAGPSSPPAARQQVPFPVKSADVVVRADATGVMRRGSTAAGSPPAGTVPAGPPIDDPPPVDPPPVDPPPVDPPPVDPPPVDP